jgi:hypothetical protein
MIRDLPTNKRPLRTATWTLAVVITAIACSSVTQEDKAERAAGLFARLDGLYCERSLALRSSMKTVVNNTIHPRSISLKCPLPAVELESLEVVQLPGHIRDALRIAVALWCNSPSMQILIPAAFTNLTSKELTDRIEVDC